MPRSLNLKLSIVNETGVTPMSKHALKGSERESVPGARAVGKADPKERLEVSVLLRRRQGDTLKENVKKLATGDKSHGYMKREDFAKQFGADAADIAAVKKFANSHGLTPVQEDAARRTVVLAGTVAQFNEAFGVDLGRFEYPGGSYRGRTGPVKLPDALNGVVEAVLGLDNRPQARPLFRVRPTHGHKHSSAAAAAATSFYPNQIAALYNFPAGNGQGECIGLIELGGGYQTADITAYFAALGIQTPQVADVSVDGGESSPTGDPNGPDGEVMLDIEVAGAVAPAARIVAYFAPNTDAGFIDAVTTAIHDTANQPSVLSISWGGAESTWTQQAMTALDEAFQAAATMGVTVCVASGDGGSSDGVDDGQDHVDFPASSSYALGCGGTSLQASNGTITSESVWNDGATGGAGGGGVSNVFALPSWQQGLEVTNSQGVQSALQNRGVPDVSGDADPQTGYNVRVDGSNAVYGGTSAVAPLWAGLIARINSAAGHSIGFINPQLYQNPTAFNDITQGNNGDFSASSGWDACTGMGSPNGAAIANVLSNQQVAAGVKKAEAVSGDHHTREHRKEHVGTN